MLCADGQNPRGQCPGRFRTAGCNPTYEFAKGSGLSQQQPARTAPCGSSRPAAMRAVGWVELREAQRAGCRATFRCDVGLRRYAPQPNLHLASHTRVRSGAHRGPAVRRAHPTHPAAVGRVKPARTLPRPAPNGGLQPARPTPGVGRSAPAVPHASAHGYAPAAIRQQAPESPPGRSCRWRNVPATRRPWRTG